MLFSSNIFLYLFLPLYLLIYFTGDYLGRRFLANRRPIGHMLNNFVLLLLSLYFYYWCSGKFILVFLGSIAINTLLGRSLFQAKRKWLLAAGVVLNLSVLIYFKYYNFFYDQLASLLQSTLSLQLPPHAAIFLPVGISFYTFMAISYLVEVYQGKERHADILRFGTYLSLFPHLVAGPIVRYSELEKELQSRQVTVSLFFEGIWRFSVGLGKKVVLANNLGAVSDKIFGLPSTELTTALSWAGALCYTLQIYFDFSGYSDMAIGLARFFGFYFPENFNQPYQSKNITEFWRRWHMTLSRWFRDYLYIGLGGNRKGAARTYVNLFLVFFLCGLWHGAAWTFVFWGIYHGILLVIERLLKSRFGFEPKGWVGQAVTFVLVMVGWVFFRAPTFEKALEFIRSMAGFPQLQGHQFFSLGYYLDASVVTYLVISMVVVLFPYDSFRNSFGTVPQRRAILAKGIVSICLLFLAFLMLAKTQFTPFIYFQF